MKKLLAILMLSVFLPVSAAKADYSWIGLGVGSLVMIIADEIRTSELPTCEKMRKENYSAWKLQHGGWGNGKLMGQTLKTCKNKKN